MAAWHVHDIEEGWFAHSLIHIFSSLLADHHLLCCLLSLRLDTPLSLAFFLVLTVVLGPV